MSLLIVIPAGMPSFTLSDAAALRMETISFFLMGFLLAAWGVQGLWNLLRRDWSTLPRLSYPAALGMTSLWGVLFVLVLTMISGARELLTPGAWEKQGATYRLADQPAGTPPIADATLQEREEHLRQLGRELLVFAAVYDGRFPSSDATNEIADEHWRLPNRPASFYRYVPGGSARQAERVVAYEPALFGDGQLVLLANGTVQSMTSDELASRLSHETAAIDATPDVAVEAAR